MAALATKSKRGDLQIGWCWASWRGYGVTVSSEWAVGFENDWYDGPLRTLSLGFLHLSYAPGVQ